MTQHSAETRLVSVHTQNGQCVKSTAELDAYPLNHGGHVRNGRATVTADWLLFFKLPERERERERVRERETDRDKTYRNRQREILQAIVIGSRRRGLSHSYPLLIRISEYFKYCAFLLITVENKSCRIKNILDHHSKTSKQSKKTIDKVKVCR